MLSLPRAAAAAAGVVRPRRAPRSHGQAGRLLHRGGL